MRQSQITVTRSWAQGLSSSELPLALRRRDAAVKVGRGAVCREQQLRASSVVAADSRQTGRSWQEERRRGRGQGGGSQDNVQSLRHLQLAVPDVLQLAGRIVVWPGQIEAPVQRILSIGPGDVGPRYSVCGPRVRPRHWHAFVDLMPVATFVDPHERTEAHVAKFCCQKGCLTHTR